MPHGGLEAARTTGIGLDVEDKLMGEVLTRAAFCTKNLDRIARFEAP
jgi:hypothetical protein